MNFDAQSRCVVCGSSGCVVAECAVSGLVIRRDGTHCFACYVAMSKARSPTLPPDMQGMWPIDFELLRRELPPWLSASDADQRTRVNVRLREIAAYFRQTWPTDIVLTR